MTDASPFVCTRWRRYGHDRLYVEASGGARIGYRDLKSGLDHPSEESDRHLLRTLADGWVETAKVPSSVTPHPVVPDTLDEVDAPRPWLDLSLNRPGQAVREQALAARSEAPVRTTLARVLGVHTDEAAWRKGADGEELVAAELAKVSRKRPAWTAIHAVPVGTRGADIDHVVLGPGGVFTVNAKHHKGADIWVGGDTILVDGHRKPYVRNARHEAQRAGRLLSAAVGQPVQVQGLIVVVNANSFRVRAGPAPGVSVLYRRQLAKWLLRLGDSLDQELLNRIWDAARRSTTWQG